MHVIVALLGVMQCTLLSVVLVFEVVFTFAGKLSPFKKKSDFKGFVGIPQRSHNKAS